MQGSSGPVVRLCCLQIDDHSRLVDLLVEPDVLASWSRPFWNCDAASAIAERSCWKPGSHQTPCWREWIRTLGPPVVDGAWTASAELGEVPAGQLRFAPDSLLEGDGFEPLVPLLGRAQLSRHARGGPLPSADSLRIQLSSSMRSAAMKASGWSSMTWCLASGTSTTGARGPIRDDM
jgi:hypothetical protein